MTQNGQGQNGRGYGGGNPNDYPRGNEQTGGYGGGGYPQDNRPAAGGGGGRTREDEEARALSVPPGEYPVRAVGARIGAAGTNTIQIGIRLRITDGDHKGKTITWYGSFTDESEHITIRAMRALGHVGDDVYDHRAMLSDNADISATAVVEHETYQGKKRAKVNWINGGDGGAIVMSKELSEGEAQRFRERMRGSFQRSAGGAGGPPPSGGGGWQQPGPQTRTGSGGRGQEGPQYETRTGGGGGRGPQEPPPHDDRDAPRGHVTGGTGGGGTGRPW